MTGAWHLGATGRDRIHVLIGLERPGLLRVAVADRLTDTLEQRLEGHGTVQPGQEQSRSRGVRRCQLQRHRSVIQGDRLAGAPALGPRPIRRSQLDHVPALVVKARGPGGEVHANRGAVGPMARHGGGERAGDVDRNLGSRWTSPVRYAPLVCSIAPSMLCVRGSGPIAATSSSLMPETRKRLNPPSPSGMPSAA